MDETTESLDSTTTVAYTNILDSFNEMISNLQSTLDDIIINCYEFNKIYTDEYLPKYKSILALKNKLIEKIERGYVDDIK